MERQRGQFVPPILHVRAPGGGGKIPLCPPAVVTRDGNALVLKNYAGHLYRYPDPEATLRVPVEPARL